MLIVLLYSCSTKKNTFTRRVFHNLTGHYNTYWNGRESFREGVDILQQSAKDNYNNILTVKNYGTKEEAQSLNPYMDKAIEKASINIQRHSMFFEYREQVRWIDDSYMLIGFSYFYKQEYNKARRTFEFVMNEYKYNDIRFDAMLWLAKTHIQLEKYKRARSVIDNLQNEIDKGEKIPDKVIKELPLVKADMFILQEKFEQAKEPLLDAIYLHQKKNVDARLKFILGQIYQKDEELYKASQYYKEAIKRNPPYEMAFNAAINLAQCYDTRYDKNSKLIVKKLKKMLKEDKNKEYLDQVYYALADIAFKEKNDSLAIDYLRSSVSMSVANNYQKVKSALLLGDIYFKQPEYELSQAYYDTAVQVIPEDYPDRIKIEARTASLTELVENILIIREQDSLQKIALMPEEARLALIDNIIKELKEKEEEERRMEELAALNAELGINTGSNTTNIGGLSGAKWYFYNETALKNGASEFKKKWGNRKLEDNWRISNKQSMFETPDEEGFIAESDSISSDSTLVFTNDAHKPEFYLQNLPFTNEAVALSDTMIMDALYNLGFIYKDKLEDYPKSIESFETLLSRFPDNAYLLQTYYQLFRVYTRLENHDKAEEYKNLIINGYPESDYAKLLLDPDYFKELEAQRNIALTFYAETYDHYEAGHYYTVLTNSNKALETYEEPKEVLARFSYLRALALGKVEVTDSLQIALEKLVVDYPESDVLPLAQNILNYLKGPSDTTNIEDTEPENIIDISMYEFKKGSKQIFAMVVEDKNVNINALKVRISDFNTKFYSLENLNITNILLNATTHFIMVGNFDEIDRAMTYYNSLIANEYVFAGIEREMYEGFIISQENYPIFYKDKDVEKYLVFFNKNYVEVQ